MASEGGLLQAIAQPRAGIPLRIRPGGRPGDRQSADRGSLRQLRRMNEPEPAREAFVREVPQKLENPGLHPLVLAERFIVDADVHRIAPAPREPRRISIGSEWPTIPRALRESKRDVVAQP